MRRNMPSGCNNGIDRTGAAPDAGIAQQAFPTMGERPGGSSVQEHGRVLQKDSHML